MSDQRETEFRAALAKALDVPDGGQYLNDFLTRIEALKDRADRAVTNLNRYGQHLANCTFVTGECRCGFREAILESLTERGEG